jgi:hypothetical protein
VGIRDGGYDATAASTEIAAQFFSRGCQVNFRQGATIACNGATAVTLTTGFGQTTDVAGRPFSCVRTSGQQTVTIAFRLPPAPAAGGNVTRSANTLIQLRAGDHIAGISALGTRDKALARIASAPLASVDTSHFGSGPGCIALTRLPTVTDVAGSAFASAKAMWTAFAVIAVTWV